MKVFKKFNTSTDEPCPICNTKDEKETVGIAKYGTQKDHDVECIQVHLDCLDLWYGENENGIKIIYQSW